MTGEGAINGVLVGDGAALSAEARAGLLPRLGRALFERGIASNLHKVYVSLAHSDEDLEQTVQSYREVLREAARWALR